MKFVKVLILWVVCFVCPDAYAVLPEYKIISSPAPVSSLGTITRMSVNSGNLDGDVIVDVWTPAKYESASDKRDTEENGRLYVYDAQGFGHNEWFWQQRVDIPLKFLLSKRAIDAVGIDNVLVDSEESLSVKYIYDLYSRRFPGGDLENLPSGLYVRNREKYLKR